MQNILKTKQSKYKPPKATDPSKYDKPKLGGDTKRLNVEDLKQEEADKNIRIGIEAINQYDKLKDPVQEALNERDKKLKETIEENQTIKELNKSVYPLPKDLKKGDVEYPNAKSESEILEKYYEYRLDPSLRINKKYGILGNTTYLYSADTTIYYAEDNDYFITYYTSAYCQVFLPDLRQMDFAKSIVVLNAGTSSVDLKEEWNVSFVKTITAGQIKQAIWSGEEWYILPS